MMKRVFFRPDGGVSVMHLVEKVRRSGETDAEFFSRCAAKVPDLSAVPFQDMDETELPPRSERANWRVRDVGGRKKIVVEKP